MPLANIELTSTFDEWRTRTNQLTIQGEKLVLDTSAAYNQANLAFNQANTGYIQANLAFNQANTGYNQANTARNVANAAYAKANATTFTSNIAIVVADNSNAALRITQTGTGLALRVEDAANPDSTPVVIDADGNVGIGTATPTTTLHVAGTANISTSLRLAGTDMITRLNNVGAAANTYCDTQFSILGSVLQTNITGANANAANASFMTTGITAIARGGTGASTPAGARTNLELGNLALFNTVNGTQIVVTSEAQGDILYRNATEWARLPAGTSGQVLKTNGSGANPEWTNSPYAPDVIIQDQKAQNADGGAFNISVPATTGQQRVLNTLVRNVDSICTLASNQFTLPAGTYYIEWSAPAAAVNAHQSWLNNVTAGSISIRGTSEYAGTGALMVTRSFGSGVVINASSSTYEIRHRATTARGTDGFGVAANFGTEIYTEVKIWKIA